MMPVGVVNGRGRGAIHIAGGAREVVPVEGAGINGNGSGAVEVKNLLQSGGGGNFNPERNRLDAIVGSAQGYIIVDAVE